jgi:hypothetical protein
VVVLIVPMLVLGTFSRATFLAHEHDEHGVHLHPVGAFDEGELAAEVHASYHGHDSATMPSDLIVGGDELAESPCCFITCFDVQTQLPTRTMDLRKPLFPEAVFPIVAMVLPILPDLDCQVGSPGGSTKGGPMGLLALSASDRLVRTSRALLI